MANFNDNKDQVLADKTKIFEEIGKDDFYGVGLTFADVMVLLMDPMYHPPAEDLL